MQRRPPDVVANNYHSFYVRRMVPGERSEVRVQFHQDPQTPTAASFAVWYQETNTLQRMDFNPGTAIRPELLQEDAGRVTFDLNGDGKADVHLVVQPNPQTWGLDFTADLAGGQLFRMSAAPPAPSRPAGPGIYMGQLPDGRSYYLVPGSTSLPNGPLFVDGRSQLVNPALEAQGAAIVQGAAQGYLIGYAILILLLGGAAIAEAGAVAETAAATEGAGALTSGQIGEAIGWGTGQTAQAVAQTEAVTQSVTTQGIRQMITRGLTREWVQAQLTQYEAAIARGGAKLLNKQLLPRLALMRRLLELWPQ